MAILLVACAFSSVFFNEFKEVGDNVVSSLLPLLSNAFFLVVPAVVSYYHRVSMRALFCFLILLLLPRLLSGAFESNMLAAVIGITNAGASAMGILIVGSILSLFDVEKAQRNILFGFACAALVLPFFHTFTPFTDYQIYQTVLVIFIALITVFLLFDQGKNTAFPSVRETVGKYRVSNNRLLLVLLTQQASTLVLLLVTVLCFFCFGMFEAYALILGFGFTTSDTIMYGLFAVMLLFCIVNAVKKAGTWYNLIFSAAWVVYLVVLFVILMMTDLPPALFGILGIGAVVMHIPIWIFITKQSVEHSLSPVFLYGSMTAVLFAAQMLGRWITLVILNIFGIEAYDISIHAAGALTVLAVVIAVLLAWYTQKGKAQLDESEKIPFYEAETNGDTAYLSLFGQRHGLSERETEIVKLYIQGRTVSNISKKCFISESTVKTHLKRVYAKLDVHSKQQLLDLLDEYVHGGA